MTAEALAQSRKRAALDHALGALVLEALAEPAVVEVLANPDGRIVVDRLGAGRAEAGEGLSAQARERVIRLVADYVDDKHTHEKGLVALQQHDPSSVVQYKNLKIKKLD